MKGFGIFRMLRAAAAMVGFNYGKPGSGVPKNLAHVSAGKWWDDPNRITSGSGGNKGLDKKYIRRHIKKRMGVISRRRNNQWPSYK